MSSPAGVSGTSTIAAQARPKPAQQFSCPECGDVFSRLDHVARHIRSHKSEKPFVCTICKKGFSRADSLDRHFKGHNGISDLALSAHRLISSRVSSACQKCNAAKLKCDGGDPCGRCRGKSLRCTYIQKSRRRNRSNHDPTSREPASPRNPESHGETVMLRTPHTICSAAVQRQDLNNLEYQALRVLTGAFMQQNNTPPESGYGVENQQIQGMASIQTETSTCLDPYVDSADQLHEHDSDRQRPIRANHHNFDLLSPSHRNTSQDIVGDWRQSEREPAMSLDETTVDCFASQSNESTTCDDLGFESMYNDTFDIMDWTTFDCTFEFPMPSVQPEYTHLPANGQHSQSCPMISNELSRDTILGNLNCSASAVRSVQNNERLALPTPQSDGIPHSLLRTNAPPRVTQHQSSMILRGDSSGGGEAISDTDNQRRVCQPRSPEHWPTNWEPRKVDNVVSFPDLRDITLDILEAEDFAHVPQLNHQVHSSIVNCVTEVSNNQNIFRPFIDSAPPSREVFNCFIQLYFEHFQPMLPIFHQATFDPTRASWVLVLAVAAIGSRFSKMKESTRCATTLEELLRRAIQHCCEKDNSKARQIWVAQAMVLNMMGMFYSGDKRLLELALVHRNGMITTCRRNGSLRQAMHGTRIDDSFKGGRLDAAWKQWTMEESYRRLAFSAWLVDCQLSLYFDMSPSMSLNEIQQQLPCKESLWEAPNAEVWKTLFLQESRSGSMPNMHNALQSLCNNTKTGSNIGDFGRLILVHAIYQTTWELRMQARNPLLRSNPILYSEKTRPAWQIVATSTLDALLPPFTDTVPRTCLQLNLAAHVHHVILLVHAPLSALLAYAGYQATTDAVDDAHQELAGWMRDEGGRTARKAVLHACILFSLVRSRPCRGLHEPVALLISTLAIWAYHQHSQQTQNSQTTTIRLDRIQKDEMAQLWINDGAELRGYLTDVGNICRPGAGKRLLQLACRILATMDAWNLSVGFGNVLNALQMRLVDPISR